LGNAAISARIGSQGRWLPRLQHYRFLVWALVSPQMTPPAAHSAAIANVGALFEAGEKEGMPAQIGVGQHR